MVQWMDRSGCSFQFALGCLQNHCSVLVTFLGLLETLNDPKLVVGVEYYYVIFVGFEIQPR